MKICVALPLAFVALLSAAPARAQQPLTLAIGNGRVTLDARNVPVRQILTEWARIGGVKIVNAEKIAGASVTLQLPDVPERQALDIILRGVSGYLLAARAPGTPGASSFDRILILPTSAPPRQASPPAQAAARAGFMAPPPVQPDPIDQNDAVPDADDNDQQARRFPGAAGGMVTGGSPRGFGVGAVPGGFGGAGAQVGVQIGMQSAQPEVPTPSPSQPGNPFGGLPPAGSGRPGVVSLPPPPPPGSGATMGRPPVTNPDGTSR